MMDELSPAPDGRDGRGPDGEQRLATSPTVVQQAGQLTVDGTVIVVHRTLADDHSPYAVLRTRHDDVVADVVARPGQEVEVPGARRILVASVRASTPERRGAVTLLPR